MSNLERDAVLLCVLHTPCNVLLILLKSLMEKIGVSGVPRQLFNWVQVIESNGTGGCIKLVAVYYSIHVVLSIV